MISQTGAGDQVAHDQDWPSRCVTIASCGQPARSADMIGNWCMTEQPEVRAELASLCMPGAAANVRVRRPRKKLGTNVQFLWPPSMRRYDRIDALLDGGSPSYLRNRRCSRLDDAKANRSINPAKAIPQQMHVTATPVPEVRRSRRLQDLHSRFGASSGRRG